MLAETLRFAAVNALAVAAVIGLSRRYSGVVKTFIYGSSGLIVSRLVSHGDYSFDTVGQFSKVMCTAPLGLGVVLLFRDASSRFQERYLDWFNNYINFAVLGNISMMAFLPTGNTFRGHTTRVACLFLLAWLVQEIHRKRWRTVNISKTGAFLFSAAPLKWVLCHAVYRGAMITLPAFETLRYVVLEPLSLGTMAALSQLYKDEQSKTEKLHDYFGFADTLVVATMAIVSALSPTSDSLVLPQTQLLHSSLDRIVVPLHAIIIGIAAKEMWINFRESRGRDDRKGSGEE